MKNNYGWGLSTMIIFTSIIAMGLIISVVMYKLNIEDEIEKQEEKEEVDIFSKTYIGLEEDIAISAKEYFLKEENLEKESVSIKELIKLGYLEEVYDLKNSTLKCSGYVKQDKKLDERKEYNTYLNCGSNYQTAGYSDDFDE